MHSYCESASLQGSLSYLRYATSRPRYVIAIPPHYAGRCTGAKGHMMSHEAKSLSCGCAWTGDIGSDFGFVPEAPFIVERLEGVRQDLSRAHRCPEMRIATVI